MKSKVPGFDRYCHLAVVFGSALSMTLIGYGRVLELVRVDVALKLDPAFATCRMKPDFCDIAFD